MDEHAQLFISNLTINVLLPASVFTSFLSGMSMDLLLSLGTILILAVGLEVFLSLASKTGGSRRFTPGQACVAHYGYLVSNGGLIGTPVIESLFGAVGVMCCNVFMIPTRILAFSAGESIFNPSLKRTPQAVLRSVATNKIIDVMALGLVMIYFNLSLPAPILTALQKIGGCLAPFSLILVGSLLAQRVKLPAPMIKNVAQNTLIRLLVIPLAALGVCLALRLDFQTAAAYHPLVFVLIPGLLYVVFREFLPFSRNRKVEMALLAAFLFALVAVYCYRMLISHAAVLETDYSNSVFYRIVSAIKGWRT